MVCINVDRERKFSDFLDGFLDPRLWSIGAGLLLFVLNPFVGTMAILAGLRGYLRWKKMDQLIKK